MNQSHLRSYLKRGIVTAGLGLGLALAVVVPANALATAAWSPTSHRLIIPASPSGTSTVTTLDSSWF